MCSVYSLSQKHSSPPPMLLTFYVALFRIWKKKFPYFLEKSDQAQMQYSWWVISIIAQTFGKGFFMQFQFILQSHCLKLLLNFEPLSFTKCPCSLFSLTLGVLMFQQHVLLSESPDLLTTKIFMENMSDLTRTNPKSIKKSVFLPSSRITKSFTEKSA